MLPTPYRVLDLTDGGAGLCGQILADLGADVILIEPPGGSGDRHLGPFVAGHGDVEASLSFWARNRGKRSLVLDLDSPDGRESLVALARGADVLVESRGAAWLESRGLGADALMEANPRLSVVSISPFGDGGPKSAWAATDLTIAASSGVLFMTGDEDRPPLAISAPQSWLHAAGDAAVGALLALRERAASGRGQRVDVSAQTSMMIATQSFVLSHGWGCGQAERLGGGVRANDLRLRFVFPCRDGYVNVTFLFGPALGKFTAKLFKLMYERGFVDEAMRDKDWPRYGFKLSSGEEPMSEYVRCQQAIEAFTTAHTKAELFAMALADRLLIVPVSDIADLAHSRQLEERAFWTFVRHEDLALDVAYPGPFALFRGSPIEYRRRPPRLGEHQAEIESELRAKRITSPPAVKPAVATPASPAVAGALPLEGLRVLDFTWVYAGPATTRVLSEFGATVLRIETERRPDALRMAGPFLERKPGNERSANFHNVNAGKMSLSLDLSVPSARDVVLRLVQWADVVVENFAPGVMKAWHLDYDRLRELKPELIMLSTCINGQTGPEAHLAGYGTMGASLAGFAHLTGWPDRPPSSPPGAYTDYIAPRFCAASILAALERRDATGEGEFVDCSQIETALHFLGPELLDFHVNGRVALPLGNARPDHAPVGVYPLQGVDRWIAIDAPNDAHWHALARVAGLGWERDERFTTAPQRLTHREALDRQIAAWTRNWVAGALEAALQGAGIPSHRVSTSQDCFADPQLVARSHFAPFEHPELGTIPLEAARVTLQRTPARRGFAGPLLGQHNDEVLRGILGLSDEEIADLVVNGAIA